MKSMTLEKPDEGMRSPGRRRFLDFLLGTGAFATLGAVFYPVFKFITPPQVIEAAQNSVVAAKVSELAANPVNILSFDSKPGIIVKTASGELKAFSAVCTHLECIVQYSPEKKQIWCACHHGQYDLTGKNVGGPPPRPLEEYTAKVQGSDIVVTKG